MILPFTSSLQDVYLPVFTYDTAQLCVFRSVSNKNSEVVDSLTWDPNPCNLLSINSGAAAALSLLLQPELWWRCAVPGIAFFLAFLTCHSGLTSGMFLHYRLVPSLLGC